MKKIVSGNLMGTDKTTCPKRVEALWTCADRLTQGNYKYRIGMEDNLAKTYTIYDANNNSFNDTLEYVKRTSYEEVTADTQEICDSNRYVFDIWSKATGEGYIYVADELPEMFTKLELDGKIVLPKNDGQDVS